MVAIMDTGTVLEKALSSIRVNSGNNLVKNFVISQSSNLLTENTSESGESNVDEQLAVRSLGMSANVASAVKSEVKHFIRINTHGSVDSTSTLDTCSSGASSVEKSDARSVHSSVLSCSRVLPPAKDSVISAIVLSRWDDIMGPQTVHVWMEEGEDDNCAIDMSRAVKYITNHTVSQAAVQNLAQPSTFVVADLEIVAEALAFGISESGHSRGRVPHAVSLLVPLHQYSSFLKLRHLCHQWLLRTAAHLHLHLKDLPAGSSFTTNVKLDNWMLGLPYMLVSVKPNNLLKLPQENNSEVLQHPLIERALTSHLQTFGCTVVMGNSATEINQFISFLALFLNEDERVCSRLVGPTLNDSFHVGLFLQGLLLDEFGQRELCSTELSASPYPVSAIDLTLGAQASAVKQTPLHPLNRMKYSEDLDVSSYHSDDLTSVHRSVLHPVKDSAPFVKEFIKDLKTLQLSEWTTFVSLFMKKIDAMAYCMLSQVNYKRCFENSLAGSASGSSFYHHLMKSLNVDDSDFLIVLAAAEKLKPGVYTHIFELNNDFR